MNESDFEGTLVLEKLAEIGKVGFTFVPDLILSLLYCVFLPLPTS